MNNFAPSVFRTICGSSISNEKVSEMCSLEFLFNNRCIERIFHTTYGLGYGEEGLEGGWEEWWDLSGSSGGSLGGKEAVDIND